MISRSWGRFIARAASSARSTSAIDPAASRELLIERGLVEGDLDTRAEFFRHNRQLLDNLQRLAAKTRQRELIVEPHLLYRFYDARLPADVSDGPRLEKWRREAETKQPKLLFLSEEDILGERADAGNYLWHFATLSRPHRDRAACARRR